MTQKQKGNAVVVGGGVAGLTAALLLAEGGGHNVYLIEREESLGGLWQTVTNERGETFTLGIHMAEQTGIQPLDEMLYGDIDDGRWHLFDTALKEGHIYKGVLNNISGCVDATHLPKEQFNQGLTEMLMVQQVDEPQNLKEQLDSIYGPTFTEELHRPAMKKFVGLELEDLAPDAHRTYVPQRLRVADTQISFELKKSPLFNSKVAHSSWKDIGGTLGRKFLYPKKGESGAWILELEKMARAKGVHVLTGRNVDHIDLVDNKVTGVELSDGTKLDCEMMVWTVPTVFFLRAAKLPLPGGAPILRDIVVCHFTVDGNINTENYYVTNYDPENIMFRGTFYNNIQPGNPAPSPHRFGIEVIRGRTQEKDLPDILAKVREEIYSTGLVDKDAKILYEGANLFKNVLPVVTPQFAQNAREHLNIARHSGQNVMFLGRASLDCFFLPQVLPKVYAVLGAAMEGLMANELELTQQGV